MNNTARFDPSAPTPWDALPSLTDEKEVAFALDVSPATATDEESRAAAQTLSKQVLIAHQLAQMPEDSFKTEAEKYAAASKIVETMTGAKDLDGRFWNGGKPFKTGKEYLMSVRDVLKRGMTAAADPDLQAWLAMSDEEKDAKLEREQGPLAALSEGMGDLASDVAAHYGFNTELSESEYEAAPEDVRNASLMLSRDDTPQGARDKYAATIQEWRTGTWRKLQRRSEYEAKLRRKNALMYLPDMIKSLKTDEAKTLAGELAQNPSAIPDNWETRLTRLPTHDIETLAQIRGMTREQVEGGFFNWLGDMGVGIYNAARGLVNGPYQQLEKYGAMAMGFDDELINETIRRKHALWSAYAGWSSPAAPLSDQHGTVANFTIGLASAVPFIASMHLKGLGYVACAGEMMSEADAQAAAAGIDTTSAEYNAINLVAGGTYAYMLKAVSPKFFGASANGAAEEMALRTAFMKGVMSGIAKLDTVKIASQRTAAGSLMMAMQQSIAAVNNDLHLGGDAWNDAAKSFTETFVSSIPDMLAFTGHGLLEGHARASGGFPKMFTAEGRANRSQNLREAVENAFAVRAAVDGDRGVEDRMQEIRREQLQYMALKFMEKGKKGLRELGLKPEVVEEAADLFEQGRREYGTSKALEIEWKLLDSQLDGQTLEEFDADVLNSRNEAKRRWDQMQANADARRDHLFETMKDVPGTLHDLASVRDVWAQGHAVGAGMADGTDAGAAALVKAGFTPEDAAILSHEFGAERMAMYSPAATEALREMYTRSTRGMVEAHAALASAFNGKVHTENGRVLIDLPMPDGGTGTLAVETVDLTQQFYGATGSDPEMARQVEHAVTSRGGKITANDWIKMSDAARRRVVKKYNLIDEGYFTLTDPADPSLHVSSGDADAVMGVIRLDPTADPGAAFHEAMHGFLRFCQETSFFDEADLKWLTDTYGKPESPREQLNEESAADGFRQYLAKRMAGSFAEEPAPFRKLFGLIGRLRHLRDSRAATERLAANAEEALYDAFLAGKYQHIRDLSFAAPAAPKAEAGTGAEAPQTGAPPKENVANVEVLPVANANTQLENGNIETGTNGNTGNIPRVVSFEALTPTGGKKIKGHYEIVPLASLLHSNMAGYPMELQQRDRKGNKGEEQTREEHIANFEPGYLLADPKTDSGAMVVARRPGPDGKPRLVVVSGNGRTMVLEEMAKRNLYDRYRNRMKKWAKENGVENTVADADNPVLVRVVDELGGTPLKELADLSNTNAIQQMNEEEQARADADLVRSLDLAKLYKPNMDGSANMAAGASDEFFREFVHATGDTSLLNSDGTFTEALRMRARRALLAIACGQGERGRDVVKKLVEDTDALGIDRQKDTAAAIAPHVAAIEARPEYAIGPDVSRAFADYIEFRENRDTGKKWGTLEEFLKQGDMLDPRSEIAESVMRLLDDPKNAPVLAETVRLYAEAAKGETDGLFGAARTRAEIWRDAANAAGEKVAVENMLANRRNSIVAEKVRPVTEKEFDAVLEKTGEQKDITWENIHAACWLLPNGKVPKEELRPVMRGGPAVQPAHESFFPLLDRKERANEEEQFIYGYADTLAGGAIRLNLESGGIEVGRKLTPAQRDSLYDILSEGYKRMELGDWPEDTLRVDIDDPFGRTQTSLEFRRGTSPFYVMNEIDAAFSPAKRHSIAGNVGAANMGIKGAAEAEAMEKAGKDREEIWRTTGWWRGTDGKWRVEIPDFTLKMETIGKEANESDPDYFVRKRKLSDIITDTQLFDAYPELKKITVQTPHHDTFGDGGVMGDYNGKRQIRLNMWAMQYDPESVRKTLAHEIQHAIQRIEGFAKGGNEGQFKEADPWAMRRKAKAERLLGHEAEAARLEAEAEEIEENALEGYVIENGEVYENTFEAYQSLAGETESRNVEQRLAMSPEERAATPPWATEDVPADRQIVRYSIRSEKDENEREIIVGERPYIKKTNQPPNRSYGSDPGLPGAIEQEKPGTAACRAIDSLDSLPNLPPRVKRATANFKAMADAIVAGKVPKGWRNPVTAENFLGTLTGFGFTKESPTSALLLLPDVSIRVSDHSGNADRFVKGNNWSIVLETKRFPKPLNKDPKKNVVEFKLTRSYLKDHPERMASLLQSMAEFAVNGEIHDTIGVRSYKFSGSDEFVTTAIERLKVDARERGDEESIAKLNAELPSFKKNFFGDWEKDPKNASKIVDEKGAPLVVYRGAQFDPLAQEHGKGVIMPEAYFTADPRYAERYGTVRAYFLNIRHPFDIRDPECLADLKKAYPNHVFQTGKSGALDWAEASVVDAEFLRDNFGSKYDGIIYDEGGDPTHAGGVKYRGLSYVPLDGGAQVKLAIGNNGDFSGHPDARYSVTARTPTDEIKADPESFARRSVVSRVIDGDAEEREAALVAFVAERALRHGPKPNAFKTIARLGLEMGLKTVDASRIVKKGEALADRVRGTVIEKAIRKGDVATATALLARESDIDRLVAGAAGKGGELVRAGEGKIKSILDREIEKHIRSFNAASLADVERDTGIDIASEILANSPEKFDPKGAAKREEAKAEAGEVGVEEGSVPGAGAPDEGNLTDFERARRERVRKEAEERVAKMIATAKQRSEAAKKEREAWEAQREERKRQAEAAAAAGEAEGGAGGAGEGGGGVGGEIVMPERPKLSTFADFKSPEEFAAFFRVWAEERYKKEHGASTLGKHEEKRLFPEFYRKAVVRELQDLADKLLPPKGARATVNRWLGEIQPGVRPDTLERISADVFAFINRNAIRESRTATIQKFRNGLQEFIKGPQFDDLKLDTDRRVTGWVEEAARYIRRVCNLSIQSINGEPSQLEKERAELQAILDRRSQVYDDEGKNPADAPLFDMETRRALAKLQLLEKYGAMKRYMPGQIADLANEAMTWLRDEAGKLEDAWKSARETEESIRAALTGGIVGPNGQKYKRDEGAKGWAERLFDSMNGMIRLRLQHLVRFADSASQQKARDAINRVVVMLGDGEVAFARHLQDDRAAFHGALAQIFATPDGKGVDRRALADWLNRMTEAIPADLSRQLSKQGYGDSMTYGQMLQLLVSLEQKSYAEAITANKRDGQVDLIRTFETVGPDGRRERVLTDKDILFIDWLRSFYEAKRNMLSEVTKRMTGLPVDSPDPLYCPVKMYMGDRARGMHVDNSAAWDPIGAVFSRRVETLRDFDESASILGQFFDRSAEAAKLVAWAERGSIIRGVFTNAGVQESIRRAFGGGELTKILKQLEETFNGGENIKKAPGEIAAADKAMNWMTYLSLGYNPLSAMKQTTSFTVWANALPGGFSDLWRHMWDVDKATIKHIKESEEYKVRYGNEVGSGHDVASKGLFENPSENPLAAFFRKTSMGLLRKGDFLPGGWIAQGLFRDLYNRHLKEGMDPQAADKLAMTETFNMLEETQQSGRTYNTAALAREHGRLGRLLVQFATSPLQQLQYETQALREVWDLQRYKPTTPDADFEKRLSNAKGKLVRAAVINHVLLPAALHAVTNVYRYAMGYDPEWDQEGWHWTMLRDITLGQFSRVFFIGAISSVTWDTLITGKPMREVPALIPAEGVVKLAGNIGVTARDIAKLDYEKVQKDLDRLLKSTSITRTPYDALRLLSGRAYADREERREKRRQKEEKAAAKEAANQK